MQPYPRAAALMPHAPRTQSRGMYSRLCAYLHLYSMCDATHVGIQQTFSESSVGTKYPSASEVLLQWAWLFHNSASLNAAFYLD